MLLQSPPCSGSPVPATSGYAACAFNCTPSTQDSPDKRYVTSRWCQAMISQREWSEKDNSCNSASVATDSDFLCFAYP
ncbi:hypothetical protein STEG23_030976 [Scotinomys teguina]